MEDRTDDELDRIGSAAGVVWQTLNSSGELTMPKLIRVSGLSRDLVLSGMGWLAREGKLQFQQRGRIRMIGLADGEQRQTDAA